MSLSVAFRRRFDGLSLDVAFDAPDGVTAIYGPSGCGKTSTVNAVAGLLRPDQGRIALDDRVLFDDSTDLPPARRRIGYVFQDARLFPHLTVAKNLGYGARFAPNPPDAAMRARVIQMLGLDDLLDRRPAGLSGGERQRVAIGRALLSSPDLLVMDEPLASLDPARKAEILPYLTRLRAGGGPPILYVSHAMAEIAALADHLIVMIEGRVTHAGPLADALADPDAAALIGPAEGGALLPAAPTGLIEDDLAQLDTPAGTLWLPRPAAHPGPLRLRILAHEVIVSRDEPKAISALNVLPARVLRLVGGPDRTLVQLQVGQTQILAAITARSARTLGLVAGVSCFVVIKTVGLIQTG
ncbi:molybdenum ABC transporter ATP-binding protein [Paracoccus tegillarcae]|uniref:Molybdenum ABC transporter ATP-binding protein n=1 Tax=Paracoccus tegillarcae TaxID=1529068 RepID=A0A2K9EVM1_9RHOB|nr:molybdenum ABC transporter ATP-binding protein [Paracoccus tegillarcae]AUH33334.1 molybdenum ABC transporter ATP-binding protein [Paracoccus tegillarcae]